MEAEGRAYYIAALSRRDPDLERRRAAAALEVRVLFRVKRIGPCPGAVTLLIFASTAIAAPGPAQSEPAAPGAAQGMEYRIGVEDLLAISVWREPDLTREVPVRPDGRISLPLLQDIDAAGKTPSELGAEIQRRLKEYLSSPSVTVIVREVNSLKAYFLGEVVTPGPVLLRSPVRLLQGLAMAGGLTPFGGRSGIIVYRKTASGEKAIELSYRDLVSGKRPDDNLVLEPGDTIIVR
jgi:polysaccharide export outer membrane protein